MLSASSLGAPESAGMAHNVPPVFALLNDRAWPSGDQLGKNPQPSRSIGFCQTPLTRRTVTIPPLPVKMAYARRFPSGAHSGIAS